MEIAQLKTDSLMFYHIYANLIMLSKSNKSVLDMNMHYLELKCFLEGLEQHPEAAMNKDCEVFILSPIHYNIMEKTTIVSIRNPMQYIYIRQFFSDIQG